MAQIFCQLFRYNLFTFYHFFLTSRKSIFQQIQFEQIERQPKNNSVYELGAQLNVVTLNKEEMPLIGFGSLLVAQSLQTKTIFLSGGMSGIGKQLALTYLKNGHNVAIFNRSLNPQIVSDFEASKVTMDQKVLCYQVDVTDYDSLYVIMGKAARVLGSPQLAINSAGIQIAKPFLELSAEDFDKVVTVNLIGSRNFAHAAVRYMKSGTQLALISSLAGIIANYTYAAYCSSKFGAFGLAKTLRIELKEKNIDVSVVCPPEIWTPMLVEEKLNAHPTSTALKSFAGTLDLEASIDYIVKKLNKRKFLIIPGKKAKLTYFLDKALPYWITFFLVDKIVKHSKRKMATSTIRTADDHLNSLEKLSR